MTVTLLREGSVVTKLAVVAAVLVAGVLAYAATRPDTFRVQRTARIRAPAEKIFPLIDDFHRWGAWSPWETMDPAMKRTYSGAERGQGAVYAWEGNRQIGAGRMEIVEASSPSRIVIKLDFIRPFEGHNVATFTLTPAGDATEVTWAMEGRATLMTRLMGVFVSMDRMIGTHFETGLARLRTATEER